MVSETRKSVLRFLFILALVVSPTCLSAQTIGVAPDQEGNINPQINLPWTYFSSPFGGSIRIKTYGSTEVDDQTSDPLLEKTIATIDTHVFTETIPLRYTLSNDNLSWEPGIGLRFDWYEIQEIGFQDIDYSGSIYRLFFNNDRRIIVLSPGLSSSIGFRSSSFELNLGGFYAPWFYVNLNQEFSSSAEGTTLLDTPNTEFQFSGSGYHSWSATFDMSWSNRFLLLSAQTSWEGFVLDFEFLGIGGVVHNANINNIAGGFDIAVGLPFIDVIGLSPVVGVQWNWNMTKDMSVGSSEWQVKQLPVRLLIGLRSAVGQQ